MWLKCNNTLGDIQAGFMKLIPLYSVRRAKTSPINVGSTEEKLVVGEITHQRDRCCSIESETVSANKNKSKRKSRSRNNSVKVVNGSQAKTMSSLQALKGAKSSRSLSPSSTTGARPFSVTSDESGPPSPCLEQEILPYTLTVDMSGFKHEKLYIHTLENRALLGTRKVRFN